MKILNESNYEYQIYFKNNSFGILISIFSSSSSKHFFVDKEQTYEEYIYDVVKITFSFIHYLKTYRE